MKRDREEHELPAGVASLRSVVLTLLMIPVAAAAVVALEIYSARPRVQIVRIVAPAHHDTLFPWLFFGFLICAFVLRVVFAVLEHRLSPGNA
jgi:hypothetical protein